jgi:NADH-quinone oxidoreductase subunit N
MLGMLPNLMPAYPELLLAVGAMVLLLAGVIRKKPSVDRLSRVSVFLLMGALLVLWLLDSGRIVTFNGLFVMDEFGLFMKTLVILGSAAAILMSGPYLKEKQIRNYEYPVLIVLATLGMMMMISANDFMALYMGLELQSLCLYVLAAINRDRQRSSEAGLKYFVLGALSSGLLLYGISLVYGFAGSTSFEALALAFTDGAPTGVVVGIVFIVAGLAFKISAVPFHMWTPDVYEGAPTPVAAFFAAAPKVAAMALVLRVLFGSFPELDEVWRQIIVLLSVLSMALGAFVAIVQTNIKRLMAYSSIGHVGYALIGVAAGTEMGVQGVLIYMAIYMTMTLGAFVCILNMRDRDGMSEEISDLAGLSERAPLMALALAILMFSLAGIPLLAGFFGKLYVFMAAVNAGLYTLAVFGVITSVVAAYYYVRIVKIMYFDEPVVTFDRPEGRSLSFVLAVTATVNSPLSFILIGPLVQWAAVAAGVLVH